MDSPIGRLKALHRELPLIRSDRPAASIVVPAEDNEVTVAAGMVATLVAQRTKIELPIYTPEEFWGSPKARRRHAILAGNLVSNPALERLYILGRHYVDHAYPGENGYLVRTVHNPHGTGINYLILGGSTTEGVQRAGDVVCEMLMGMADRLTLMPTLAVGSRCVAEPAPEADYCEARLAELRVLLDEDEFEAALGGVLVGAAQMLDLSGDYRWARLLLRAWRVCTAFAQTGRDPWWAPYSAAHRWLWRLVTLWDNVEELPAFTDENRLAITRRLLSVARSVAARWQPKLATLGESPPCAEALHAAASLYEAGRYFGLYYELAEARAWQSVAVPCLRAAASLGEGNSPGVVCAYDVASLMHLRLAQDGEQETTDAKDGSLLRRAVMLTDNLGRLTSYGATRLSLPEWGMALRARAWRSRDGAWLWPLRTPGEFRPGGFHTDVQPNRPADWAPVAHVPVPERILAASPVLGEGAHPPADRSFDKLAFRTGFGEKDEYLLLSGASYGAHAHQDVQAIIRLTAEGQLFMADTGRAAAEVGDHSSLLVVRDGRSGVPPPFARLDARLTDRHLRAAISTVSHYNGTHWHRAILNLPGLGFVIVDQVEAVLSATFDLVSRFRFLGDWVEYPRRVVVRRNDAHIAFRGITDCDWRVRPERHTYDGVPAYGDDPQLQSEVVAEQHVRSSLLAGQRVAIAGLINVLGAGLRVSMVAEQLSDSTFSILPVERRTMLLCLDASELGAVGITTDAKAFVLWERLILLGAQRYDHEGVSVESTQPFCLVLDPIADEAQVESLNDARLKFTSFGEEARFRVQAGARIRANLPVPSRAIQSLVSRLSSRRAARWQARGPTQREPKDLQAAWRVPVEQPVVAWAGTASDDAPIVIAAGREVISLSRQGTAAWRCELPEQATGLADWGEAVAVPCADGSLRVVREGAEVGAIQAHIRPAQARAHLAALDTDEDRRDELVVAAGTHIRAFRADGTLMWRLHLHAGGILAMQTLSWRGGPVIAVSTEDGLLCMINARGGTTGQSYEPGPAHCLLPLGLPGSAGLLVGGENAVLTAFRLVSRGELVAAWQTDLGDRVTCLALRGQDILAGARSGWACQLGPDGQEQWRRSLGPPLSAVAAIPDGVVFGSADGVVLRLSTGGAVTARARLSGEILGIIPQDAGWTAIARDEVAFFS